MSTPHYLYLLYSTTIDRYYIGTSANLATRYWFHNHTDQGWTLRGQPWALVFARQFASKSEAERWERWLKRNV